MKKAIVLAFAIVVAAFGAVSLPASAAKAPPGNTFNPNLLLPGSSGAAEPSIRTNSAGESFVIGPTGGQCQAMRVVHNGSSAKFIGAPDHNAGGGDCDWSIGPKETSSLPSFPTPSTDDVAFSIASSGVRNVSTDSTGPKISSCAMRLDCETRVKNVGANQKPRVGK